MAKKKDDGKVDIHGKEYKTVALRVQEFRDHYPAVQGWSLQTQIVSIDADAVVVVASIENDDGRVVATGHAEEVRSASKINRTSALENAETSAVGRALAFLGFAGTELASADELVTALEQQAAIQDRPHKRTGGAHKWTKAHQGYYFATLKEIGWEHETVCALMEKDGKMHPGDMAPQQRENLLRWLDMGDDKRAELIAWLNGKPAKDEGREEPPPPDPPDYEYQTDPDAEWDESKRHF